MSKLSFAKVIIIQGVFGGLKYASQMLVHLFNWPVSPSLGWADPVKITISGEALKRGGSKRVTSAFYDGLKTKFI
jgi:hypothetical protein